MKIISSLIFFLFSLGIWLSLFTMVYYQYERQQLLNAYKAVKNDNISIRNAAKQYGIPRSTLQDRVKERINIDAISVKQTFFTTDEEIKLVSHIKDMASRGYGYTRAEVCHIASDYARWLGKASQGDMFSINWLYCRMERHPGLSVNQPKGLSSARTAASSPEVIESFFTQLFEINEKYDLTYSPERIYKIDENGFNAEHKPINVLAPMKRKIYSITSPRSTNATLIGASNTLGMFVPPFIFFQGQRLNDKLMHDIPNEDGVTVSESGCRNSAIFSYYLTNHFSRYVQGASFGDEYLLMLYDGHKSHISPGIIEWAKDHKIILFVCLPTHFISHIFGCWLFWCCWSQLQCRMPAFFRQASRQSNHQIWHGSNHKWLIFQSNDAIYHYGIENKGIYHYNPAVIPASSLEPLRAFHPQTSATTDACPTANPHPHFSTSSKIL